MLLDDLAVAGRQAGRALRRRPLFTTVAVVTVAAGIAASTAAFVLVDAALLSPLPFREPERLVAPQVISTQGFRISLSVPNYRDWSSRNRVLETSAASAGWGMVLSGHGPARVVELRELLGDFFGTLGMQAEIGRLFNAAETEPGAAPVAVLGWSFYRELGGDPSLLGSALQLDDTAYTIVGVLPRGVGYPSAETKLYLPLGVLASKLPFDDRDSGFGLRMLGRLRSGVTLAAAQADFDRVAAEVQELEGHEVDTPRLEALSDVFVGRLRAPFGLLFAAAVLVVLLAVANVTNLFLARGEARRDELAVRSALGAPRWDLLRLQLAESLWIGIGGTIIGLAGALAATPVFRDWLADELPLFVAERVAVGPRAVLFAVGILLVVAAALAVLPAWTLRHGGRAAILHGAREISSRRAGRLRASLVIGQLVLGTILAVAASLLATSVQRLQEVDKGFDEHGVVAGRIGVPRGHFADHAAWLAFHRRVLDRASSLPGVRSASLSLLLPLTDRSWEMGLFPEGVDYAPRGGDSVLLNIVSPDYFSTLGVELVRGRLFAPGDRDGAELVAVVDESLAERYWPGKNPVGRRVSFEVDGDPHSPGAKPVYRTIVGVVKNLRHYELQSPSRIQIYVPYEQTRGRSGFDMYLALRTESTTTPLVAALPRLVAEIDPDVPISRVAPLVDLVDGALAQPRLLARTAATLGGLALLLSGIGVFAVVSYSVAARRRELGLRQALGAAPRDLLAGVLRNTLRWCALGCLIGCAAAAIGSRLAASLLWGVGAFEPGSYVGATTCLALIALAGTAAPALQAMRVDPAIVLRDDN